jgi:hypothetical protein
MLPIGQKWPGGQTNRPDDVIPHPQEKPWGHVVHPSADTRLYESEYVPVGWRGKRGEERWEEGW